MSRKSALENACLDNGWFAYAGTPRGTFITPPPPSGQEPNLTRETAAGNIAFSGSQQAAIAWVKAHPRPGCPVLNQQAHDALRLTGAPVRTSAYQWGRDFPDLPFGEQTVHVTFRIGGDRNGNQATEIHRYMHADTYRRITIDQPATLADFEALGSVLPAPPSEELWRRNTAEGRLAREQAGLTSKTTVQAPTTLATCELERTN